MKIKICGLKDPGNIKAVAQLAPDYMGFICFAPSPRFIDDLSPADLDVIPAGIIKTGVFVNESAENIDRMIVTYHFDAVQLHGNEDAEFCRSFKDKVIVIKALGIDNDFDFEPLNAYKNSVHYFLFDTKTSKHGGSGLTFDWSLLNKYQLDIPFFLSGGLSPENLEEVKGITHPQFHGVDLNSKFEIQPGLKDISKLKKAFELLR